MKEYASLEVWNPFQNYPWYIRHYKYIKTFLLTLIILIIVFLSITIFLLGRDYARRKCISSLKEGLRVGNYR